MQNMKLNKMDFYIGIILKLRVVTGIIDNNNSDDYN